MPDNPETPLIKQKQAGVILLILGGFLFFFIFLTIYFRGIRVRGFPEFLPAQETVLYAEFPLALQEPLKTYAEKHISKNIEKDIAAFSENRGAIALLKKPGSENLFPLVFLQIKSRDVAAAFFKNSKQSVKFFGDVLAISENPEAMTFIEQKLDSATKTLASDRSFITLFQKLPGKYFVYLKPQEFPDEVFSFVAQNLPSTPVLTHSYETVAASLEPNEGIWYGKTISMGGKRLSVGPEPLYFGRLLPFIPAEFDMLLTGQDLPKQIEKMSELMKSDGVNIETLLELFGKEFLPFLEKEFAFATESKKWLILAEIEKLRFDSALPNLRAATKKLAVEEKMQTREITLPDGTKAAELIPSQEAPAPFSEMFEGVQIGGFPGFYDAFSNNAFLFSNDLNTLKKTIYLTQGSGFQFRESNEYRALLQPIVKNPELAGVANLPFGQFAFSKRTFSDHMETNFAWRSK